MATTQGQTGQRTVTDKQKEQIKLQKGVCAYDAIDVDDDEDGDNDSVPWTKTSVKLFSSPTTHSYAASSARVHLLIVSLRIPPTLSKIYLTEREKFSTNLM